MKKTLKILLLFLLLSMSAKAQQVEVSHDFEGYPDYYELITNVDSEADSILIRYESADHIARHTYSEGIIEDKLKTRSLSYFIIDVTLYADGGQEKLTKTFKYADHFWAVEKAKRQ